MSRHQQGKVVVFFGNFPLTIRLPAAPRDEQLDFLRDRIIFHTHNLVEYGLWDAPLTDVELERILSDAEIEPVFSPNFCSVLSLLTQPWRLFRNIFR